MITCANCQSEALYTYQINPDYLVHYCQSHLPRFLTAARDAGQLNLVVPVAETPAPSKKKTTVSAPVEEPAPVDETPAA
jgi:hypothetical protein